MKILIAAMSAAAVLLGLGTLSHQFATAAPTHARKAIVTKEANNKYSFSPAKTGVKVGTMVVWTNKTDVAHNVTFDMNKKVNMDFKPGKSVHYSFMKAGTYAYHCEYHPYMHGKITVTH